MPVNRHGQLKREPEVKIGVPVVRQQARLWQQGLSTRSDIPAIASSRRRALRSKRRVAEDDRRPGQQAELHRANEFVLKGLQTDRRVQDA